jgi:hypothetical protein
MDVFPSPVTRSGATVSLSLPQQSSATLKLYTETGALVRTIFERKSMDAGTASIHLAGDKLSSGLYVLVFEAEQGRDIKRLVILK